MERWGGNIRGVNGHGKNYNKNKLKKRIHGQMEKLMNRHFSKKNMSLTSILTCLYS